MRKMLEHVKRVRETPGGDYVYNLCIEHVANNNQDPVPWDVIDVIMEYAPSGARSASSNLFVGSSNLKWSGAGSKYREGVQDAAFRADALIVAEDYARQFHARYGSQHWYHFYVDFEAVANWWTEPDTRTGYVELLSGWQTMYEGIVPGRAMLYCPAYWNLNIPAGMSGAVGDLFSRVRQNTGVTRNWLSFQDMFGRRNDQLDPTPQTTLNWYQMFKATGMFDSLGVTPELFETTATTYGTGDPTEVAWRLSEYDRLGIPIRFMFELRYWYAIEQALGRVPTDPIPDPSPPPPEDAPAYMTSHTFGPSDPEWAGLRAIVPNSDDLVEATIVGLHDD
jgi:hypothetical protein